MDIIKKQIIDLWRISFPEDSAAFTNLFFDRVYKDENSLIIKKNNQVISTLQILPYDMTYFGATIKAGYIYGACTLPSERGKGFMNRLMLQALEEMRIRDYALAILIPASPQLFDYYRKFGFTNAFDYSMEEIYCDSPAKNSDSKLRIFPQSKLSPDTIFTYYHLKQRKRDCSVLHSAYQFEIIRLDLNLEKGEIWTACENEKPVGLAFSILNTRETVSIREIMYDNTEIKKELVQSILNHYNLHRAKLFTFPTLPNSVPYGMARIIDIERIIELYRSFHGSFQAPDFKTPDIPFFTQKLLKYEQRRAFMNLMLD